MPRRPAISQLRRTLRGRFKLEKLRPGQEEVIRSVLDGRDTLAIMPTGAGKSLCYQLPALELPGTTIVVSPLISLMKDQADKLDDLGVPVSQVNSALTTRETNENLEQIEADRSDFVFTTPERMTTPSFLESLRGKAIDVFVVDEAHCISEWGHDFRPAFLALREAIAELGRPRVLALTATATPAVVDDIVARLGLVDPRIINTGVYRPNLQYEVLRTPGATEKDARLDALLGELEGSGIVYTATVKNCDALAERLQGLGLPAAKYHGRMPSRERHETQDRFMAGDVKVVVATNAFGMGIDKPDIRFVVHYDVPGSLEAYYQESGRAGRDGESARCLLLYRVEDRRTQQFFLGGRYPRFNHLLSVYRALEAATRNGSPLPRLADLRGAAPDVPASKVRVALNLLKEAGIAHEGRGAHFSLLRRDVGSGELETLAAQYAERGDADRERLERMLQYAQSALCRWKLLLEYFGEAADWERCGHCDNCLHPVQAEEPRSRTVERPLPQSRAVSGPDRPGPIRRGEVVRLPEHGRGEVLDVQGDKVLVSFADGAQKLFSRDFVQRDAPDDGG